VVVSRPLHSVARFVVLLVISLATISLAFAGDPERLLHEADQYMLQGRFDLARSRYEQAMQQGADLRASPARARNLGQAYLKSVPARPKMAADWLRLALERDPREDGARALLAEALARAGSYDEAADQYRQLVRLHPETTDYVLGLTNALYQGGRSDAALQFLQSTLEKYPNWSSVRLEYARLLNYTKRFSDAKRQYQTILRDSPESLAAQIGVAKATSWEGDQEAALQMYNRILQRHPGSYDAMVGKAFSLLWTGRAGEAAPLFVMANRLHPEDIEVREQVRALLGPEAASHPRQELQPAPSISKIAPHPPVPAKAVAVPANAPQDHAGPGAARQPASPEPYGPRLPNGAWIAIVLFVLGVLVLIRLGLRLLQEMSAGRTLRAGGNPDTPLQKELQGQQQITSATEIPASLAPGTRQDVLRGTHILLVGKEAALLEVERRFLARADWQVTTFGKWHEAAAWLQCNHPDAILVNTVTDDLWSSSRIYKWILTNRKDLARKTVLVLTVGDEAGDELQASAICVVHPFRGPELLSAIEKAVAGTFVPPSKDRALASVENAEANHQR
jgi:tetratricopeptide (TPR) repeat protein